MSRQQHIDSLEQQRVAMSRDVEKIARDTKAARGEVGTSAKRTVQALKDDAKGAVRHLRDDARNVASEAGSDTKSMAKERVVHGAKRAVMAADPRPFVREQPLVGLAAGIGLGLLASLFFGTRKPRVVYEYEYGVPAD